MGHHHTPPPKPSEPFLPYYGGHPIATIPTAATDPSTLTTHTTTAMNNSSLADVIPTSTPIGIRILSAALWFTWYLQSIFLRLGAGAAFVEPSCLPAPALWVLTTVVMIVTCLRIDFLWRNVSHTPWQSTATTFCEFLISICASSPTLNQSWLAISLHVAFASLTFWDVDRRGGCLAAVQVSQLAYALFLLDTYGEPCYLYSSSTNGSWMMSVWPVLHLSAYWLILVLWVGTPSSRPRSFLILFATGIVLNVLTVPLRQSNVPPIFLWTLVLLFWRT